MRTDAEESWAAARVPAGTAPRLSVRVGDHQLSVGARGLTLGRAPTCDVRLDNALVSRRHARLAVDDVGLTVRDLGSRNGVFVNGQRICALTHLREGDVITIGIDAIEIVAEHEPRARCASASTLPPPLHGRVPEGFADIDGPELATVPVDLHELTRRELDVLSLLVFGHTQKEVAEKLGLSVKTVETHRARLCDKLGCRTRAELVCVGISAGLLRGR